MTAMMVQAHTDTIGITKKWYSLSFQTNGWTLTNKQLEKKLRKDVDAAVLYQDGKNIKILSSVVSFAGGFLIGYDQGRARASRTPKNLLVEGIGVGLIAVSIPINIAARRSMIRAVQTYNYNKRKTAASCSCKGMYLTFTGSTVGVRVGF